MMAMKEKIEQIASDTTASAPGDKSGGGGQPGLADRVAEGVKAGGQQTTGTGETALQQLFKLASKPAE